MLVRGSADRSSPVVGDKKKGGGGGREVIGDWWTEKRSHAVSRAEHSKVRRKERFRLYRTPPERQSHDLRHVSLTSVACGDTRLALCAWTLRNSPVPHSSSRSFLLLLLIVRLYRDLHWRRTVVVATSQIWKTSAEYLEDDGRVVGGWLVSRL
ncbi:hypothetical protein R1flu_017688 [Riccia fluitans]|uniref:Uncharacterized protein n=1 Tax=Riccia fluitans TaxID=41844 RepID=A0ABD1ZDN5_9MARC